VALDSKFQMCKFQSRALPLISRPKASAQPRSTNHEATIPTICALELPSAGKGGATHHLGTAKSRTLSPRGQFLLHECVDASICAANLATSRPI